MNELGSIIQVGFAKVRNLLRDSTKVLLVALLLTNGYNIYHSIETQKQLANLKKDTLKLVNYRYYCIETTLAEGFMSDIEKEKGHLMQNGRRLYDQFNGYYLIGSVDTYDYTGLKPTKNN